MLLIIIKTGGGMKKILLSVVLCSTFGCATLTEDAMTPVALSFSDGSYGTCKLTNKRGAWEALLPTTVSIRKSDDDLKYDCTTDDKRTAFGSIPSTMGGKIIASAVFLDFGIVDSITDKHRQYPASFVIPLGRVGGPANSTSNTSDNSSNQPEQQSQE